MFDQKLAQWIQQAVKEIAECECLRKLPGKTWLLERRFKEFFGQQRELQSLTVNQTVIGISEEVRRRVADMLVRKTRTPTIISDENVTPYHPRSA